MSLRYVSPGNIKNMTPPLPNTHSLGKKNSLGIYCVIASVTAFNPAFS